MSFDTYPAPSNDLALLIWDAPNIDMGLGSILGGRPSANYRPRFDAVGRWLLERSEELSEDLDVPISPEATVFTNVTPGAADGIRSWVEALRNVGFAVFAKPKLTDDSDVDPDMLNHIDARHNQGVLRSVFVASADGQNFKETLDRLVDDGVHVCVVGFQEHASWAVTDDRYEFCDLEDIPGVFREPLPRVSLDSLPEGGAWLQPFRPLSSL